MKYPNCQFENRNKAESFGDCGKLLRQEIVCPQYTAGLLDRKFCDRYGQPLTEQAPASPKPKLKQPSVITPAFFTDDRYQQKKFHGVDDRKKVCLAHDVLLDMDAAFAIINTRKSDDVCKIYI